MDLIKEELELQELKKEITLNTQALTILRQEFATRDEARKAYIKLTDLGKQKVDLEAEMRANFEVFANTLGRDGNPLMSQDDIDLKVTELMEKTVFNEVEPDEI